MSVYTIADWKRRPEWSEAVKAIADKQMGETYSEMLAMASYAREVIQDLMRKDAPPALRLQAAQAVLRLWGSLVGLDGPAQSWLRARHSKSRREGVEVQMDTVITTTNTAGH